MNRSTAESLIKEAENFWVRIHFLLHFSKDFLLSYDFIYSWSSCYLGSSICPSRYRSWRWFYFLFLFWKIIFTLMIWFSHRFFCLYKGQRKWLRTEIVSSPLGWTMHFNNNTNTLAYREGNWKRIGLCYDLHGTDMRSFFLHVFNKLLRISLKGFL